MTGEDANYYVETMSELQRKVILLCSKTRSPGYSRLADKLGVTYADVQQVGWFLTSANLAEIKLIKPGYSGSAIFLNERGEQVKQVVIQLENR